MVDLSGLFQTSAERHPDRPALLWGDHRMTYGQLSQAVDQLAAHFPPDVTVGQRVGVLAANTPALVVGMLATWRRGAVAVPLSARWREYELRRILSDAQLIGLVSVQRQFRYSFVELMSKLVPCLPTLRWCLFVDPWGRVIGNAAGPASHAAESLGGEIGIILYTSGTTGMPKGALMKHLTPVDATAAANAVLESTPEDVSLLVIPISHAFGLMMFLATLASGGLAVLVESTFSLGPLATTMRRCRPTILHGSPSLFTSLVQSFPQDLATVRTGLVGGTICPPWLLERLDEVGVHILNSYGMTEIGVATSCRFTDPQLVRHTSVGRPLPGYTFRIVGGESGEVQVTSLYVTPGYFRQPELTAEAFDEGWFRTGDLGTIDKDGNVFINGRAKEVIHVAGLKVFPAEVEGCLMTHPDVLQAVVLGAPHNSLGEAPQAFVVPRPNSGLTSVDLLQFARRFIAGYKLPYLIHLVSDLPCLETGKPDRAALARSIAEKQYAQESIRT